MGAGKILRSGRQLSSLGLSFVLLIILLGSADVTEARLLGWGALSDLIKSGPRILEGTPISPSSGGNPGCPEGEVGWANCGNSYDTTNQVCINGYVCTMGQSLCAATCYDSATASCISGVLSGSPGANDGSQTENCTLPLPYNGPVACAGDGCPIETGAPLPPAAAPATSAAQAPTSAVTSAVTPVAKTSAPSFFGGNPGCPDGLVGWANCGSALDTKTQVCINSHICSVGQALCGATCYTPAAASCVKATLSSAPGASDGSQTLNCTTPQAFSGPVACNGDGCPITTGAPEPPPPAAAAAAAAVTATTSNSSTTSSSSKDSGGGTDVGAIVGGVLGGTAGLALIAGAVFFLLAKRREAKQPLGFQSMKKEIAFQDMPSEQSLPPQSQ